MSEEKGISTFLNHPPRFTPKPENPSIISPLYMSAKFKIDPDLPLSEQFLYSRVTNPNTRELELTLAKLQGVEEGIVLASGVAAITNGLLALLETGDHAIHFIESYRPARIFFRTTLKRFGITSSMISMGNLDELERVVTSNTKLLYFESPTNPNLTVVDIKRLRAFCDKHQLLLVMDNTFAGCHQHHGFGIDLFIHSLTKFVNGHGDMTGGALLGSNALIQKIRPFVMNLGAALDPHSAFMVQRGLRTYMLRYKQQTKTAGELAAWLKTQVGVKKVYYPDSELARAQMKDLGAVVALELDESKGVTAEAFCRKLKMIQVAVSLGSTETLIIPTEAFYADDMSEDERKASGFNKFTMRISVGLEELEDLKADLLHAF